MCVCVYVCVHIHTVLLRINAPSNKRPPKNSKNLINAPQKQEEEGCLFKIPAKIAEKKQ